MDSWNMSRFDYNSHSSPAILSVRQIVKLCPALLSCSAKKGLIIIPTHLTEGHFMTYCDTWHKVGP